MLGNFTPLFRSVQLVRHAAFGWAGWADIGHLGVVMRRVAIAFLRRRLID